MKNLLNMNKSSVKIKEYIDESKLLGLEFSKININKDNLLIGMNSSKLFYLAEHDNLDINVKDLFFEENIDVLCTYDEETELSNKIYFNKYPIIPAQPHPKH